MKVTVIGIAWYRREDYSRLLEVFPDAQKLPEIYDDWLKGAELGERKLSSSGVRVIRIVVEPDEFTRWCQSAGCDLDANARTRFASERVAHIVGVQNN